MATREGAARILIVDDRAEMAAALVEGLTDAGFVATAMTDSAAALEAVQGDAPIDVLVTDLRMPGVDGLALLDASLRAAPDRPVVVMTAFGAIDSAIDSIRRGAYHYLTKPFKLEELVLFLRRALDHRGLEREARSLRRQLGARGGVAGIVGESDAMRTAIDTLLRAADSSASVLLLGETGTGKSMLARVLHDHSPRKQGPFVAVNCAAIPEALLESELFGHARGAFTGATSARRGLFVESDRGTLLLDEIGDLAPSLQAKLLHVLERGVVRPVGGNRDVEIDVRVVAATHQDLATQVERGLFRTDLLYRLDVVRVRVPSLRERKEDLPALIEHFFDRLRAHHPRSPAQRLAPATLARLLAHDWPGNVRELAHVIERLVVLAHGPEIGVEALPETLVEPAADARATRFTIHERVALRELQRRYARWLFQDLHEHRGHTAAVLGIDYKTLAKLLRDDADGEGP